MNKMKYIKPGIDVINVCGKQDLMDWAGTSKTATWDNFANENTFEDEDDPWGNLSGWDDLSSWGTDE